MISLPIKVNSTVQLDTLKHRIPEKIGHNGIRETTEITLRFLEIEGLDPEGDKVGGIADKVGGTEIQQNTISILGFVMNNVHL